MSVKSHVILQDDVSIHLHKRQSSEEHKCSEDVVLAAQMVSHTENTSSYTISVGRDGR